jgi:predicted nucleic-acid-binding protein
VIGLDTNVVVRYLVQDDPRQSPVATRLFERELSSERPGVISLITLCEIVWVLADCYDTDKGSLEAVIEGLLTSRQVLVEDTDLVWGALRAWRQSSADFSDALLGQVLLARGCERVLTFDKAATRLPGFELLGA